MDNSDPSRPRWHLFNASQERQLDVAKPAGQEVADGDVIVLTQATATNIGWAHQALQMLR